MTIETKYNIGDKAWFVVSHGVLTEESVTGISVNVLSDGYVSITYTFAKEGNIYFRNEEKLFPTKDELLNNLIEV